KNIRLQFGQRFTRYRSGEVSRVTSNRAASICGLAMGGRKTILAGLRKIASIQIPTSDCLQKASSSRLPITHEDPESSHESIKRRSARRSSSKYSGSGLL